MILGRLVPRLEVNTAKKAGGDRASLRSLTDGN
jgi:hypothetical protein